MKKYIPLFIAIILFTSLFLPNTFIDAESTAQTQTVTIIADGVNVREGPGLSYPVVERTNKNNSFPFISEQNDWYEIELPNGKNAWVANWLAKKDKLNGNENANEQVPQTATVTTNDLRIRNGPGTDEAIVGYLNRGDTVQIISTNDNWVRIISPVGNGWISTQFISFNEEVDLEATGKNIGIVITESLNIRSSPSINAKIIGKLHANNEVTIISEVSDWFEISYGQTNGWINKQYVHIKQKKQKKQTQASEADADIPKGLKGKIGTITASTLNVRKTNSLKAKVIGIVKSGQHFKIVEEGNNWVKIEYKPRKFGWIARWYIEERTEQEKTTNNKQKVKNSYVTILYPHTNVRERADINSAVVQRVNKGERYPIVSMHDDWYEIKLTDGTKAFVAGWIVSTSGPVPKIAKSGPEQYVKNKTIVIDPGHGGRDNGTTGVLGTIEKHATLKTAHVVSDKLRAAGAHVILTRTNDTYVSLAERVTSSNYHETDAFISIHFDSIDDPSVRGMTTYYYYEPYKQMATSIHSELISATNLKNRDIRYGDYYVLRENQRHATLLELGYLSNPSEEAYITTPQFRELIANGIYRGLAQYFK